MQFIKTLKGDLVNVEMVSHVSVQGDHALASVSGSAIQLTKEEAEALEKQVSAKPLVEPPKPKCEEQQPAESGSQEAETEAPDDKQPQQMAEAAKRAAKKK